MASGQEIVGTGAASGVAAMLPGLPLPAPVMPTVGPAADAGARLAVALRWDAVATLPLSLAVAPIGNARFGGEAIDPTAGREGRAVLIDGHVVDDTVRQHLLLLMATLGVAAGFRYTVEGSPGALPASDPAGRPVAPGRSTATVTVEVAPAEGFLLHGGVSYVSADRPIADRGPGFFVVEGTPVGALAFELVENPVVGITPEGEPVRVISRFGPNTPSAFTLGDIPAGVTAAALVAARDESGATSTATFAASRPLVGAGFDLVGTGGHDIFDLSGGCGTIRAGGGRDTIDLRDTDGGSLVDGGDARDSITTR